MKCFYCGLPNGNRYCNRCLNIRNFVIKTLSDAEYNAEKDNNTPKYIHYKEKAKQQYPHNDWIDEDLEYETKNFFMPEIIKNLQQYNETLISAEIKKLNHIPVLTEKEIEGIIFWRSLSRPDKEQIRGYIDGIKNKNLSQEKTN